MAKGVIDGAMVPWEGVPAAKLQEIAKSHLDVAAGQPKFANSIFAFVMNQARYDSLPADLKKVIDDNSGVAGVGPGPARSSTPWWCPSTSWRPTAATRSSCSRRRSWRAGPRPPPTSTS